MQRHHSSTSVLVKKILPGPLYEQEDILPGPLYEQEDIREKKCVAVAIAHANTV